MKPHKETSAKGKLQPSSKFCFHQKINHSNLDPKQTASLFNNNHTKRLTLPTKKLDNSFSSATIESTNKNIQKDRICQRASLLRSKSVLTNNIKKEKCHVVSDDTSSRKKTGEFEKRKKILKMKALLYYDDKENDDKTNNFDALECSNKLVYKQTRSKSESRASSPQKNIIFDIMLRETDEILCNNQYTGTSLCTSKSIVRDPGKFVMVRKFFEEPSLKRSYSLSSIKQNFPNKYSLLFKNSYKFKDLNNFFKNLEKLNELKRSTSCVDIRPIRRELDLIDYDVWKSTHDNVKTKKKFETLYAQIKEMEKAKHFLYECSNASSNKWKKDEDFGLRNRIRTINDLRKIFTSMSGHNDIDLKNNVNRKSLENDELFKKHGVSNCLIKMLSSSQMNKLRKQLIEIYEENMSENKRNQNVDLKINKNKSILKPLFLNRGLNIKSKIQYYENKLYCAPVGNTIYRAKSDLEQNVAEYKNNMKTIYYDRKKNESLKLTSSNGLSSKSISCLAPGYQDREHANIADQEKLPFYTRTYGKSVSTEDLSTHTKQNEVKNSDATIIEKNVASKSVLKSNKGDIYERLNSFILKKLENINGKYILQFSTYFLTQFSLH